MLIYLSARASVRGWYWLSTQLVELDCWISGLGRCWRRAGA